MTLKKRKRELDIEYEIDGISEIGMTILVTAGPGDFKDLQNSLIHCNEAMVAIGVVRMMLLEAYTSTIKSMIKNGDQQLGYAMNRSLLDPEIIFREKIDLNAEGLLIDGKVPGVWIHLGHGGMDDLIPLISTTDEGSGKFITTEQVTAHLHEGEGNIWMAIMPVCNGSEIAEALAMSDNILHAWGSFQEQPHWSWDEIINFTNQINSKD